MVLAAVVAEDKDTDDDQQDDPRQHANQDVRQRRHVYKKVVVTYIYVR